MCIQCVNSVLYISLTRAKNGACSLHGALSEVCGEFTLDCSTVSCWTNHSRGGCVSIDNDPRSGRLRTSTDERM